MTLLPIDREMIMGCRWLLLGGRKLAEKSILEGNHHEREK
jgi:hypothetical protein